MFHRFTILLFCSCAWIRQPRHNCSQLRCDIDKYNAAMLINKEIKTTKDNENLCEIPTDTLKAFIRIKITKYFCKKSKIKNLVY